MSMRASLCLVSGVVDFGIQGIECFCFRTGLDSLFNISSLKGNSQEKLNLTLIYLQSLTSVSHGLLWKQTIDCFPLRG